MWHNAHDTYREERILSADPLELVRLLYQAATSAVRDARSHLAAGDIAARSRAISKAHRILAELTVSLDHQRGGEISRRLAQLYDYMMRRLIEANFRQSDPPLAEVLGLLATLAEGWNGIKPAAEVETPKSNPWAHAAPEEAASASSSQGWSF